MNVVAKIELIWYRNHGRYKERITTDNTGEKYVIGDWAWNRKSSWMCERIEHRIKYHKGL